MTSRIHISEENKKIICEEYQKGISAMKLAEKYLFNKNRYRFITDIIKENNIPMRSISHRCIRYSINEYFFDKIDTEEKAYILGFLYADGGHVRNSIFLSLHPQDLHILEQFSKIMETNKPIKKYKNNYGQDYVRLSISNQYMIKCLNNYGIIKRKTFKIIFPKWIDKNLLKHFIRGYFDGDGCITISSTKNKALVTITSNNNFVKGLKKNVENFIDINCLIQAIGGKQKVDKRIKRFTISGNRQILKFLTWIYKDSNIFLQRKYKKFIQLKQDPISRNNY